MPLYDIEISDEITFQRACCVEIEAKSKREALRIADRMTVDCVYPDTVVSGQAPGTPIDYREEQIYNTPWEIVVTLVSKARRTRGS
jgi:hypothetical protein